jgi:hypothetical protein
MYDLHYAVPSQIATLTLVKSAKLPEELYVYSVIEVDPELMLALSYPTMPDPLTDPVIVGYADKVGMLVPRSSRNVIA